MLSFRLLSCGCVFLVISAALRASAAPRQTADVVSQTAQVLPAATPVSSVVMTGTAQWTAGSVIETGPAKLTANLTGQSAEFDLSSGTRIESQSGIGDDRTCTWTDKDGISHDVVSSNCWLSIVWFAPQIAVQTPGLPPVLQSVTVPGSRPHIRYWLHVAPGKTSAKVTAQIKAWSQADLILDPVTLIPASLTYMVHPDKNSSVNLQVEVRYGNYKTVSGVQLPMHIERYVNGSLQVSINIDSAVINQ